METLKSPKYSAFDGTKLLYQGTLSDVVMKIKKRLGRAENNTILIFSDATGKSMDFNFHGSEKDVLKRLEVFTAVEEPRDLLGPGRPKLGVVSREISLLPRHWEWLATQSGGASVTLRKLVDEARKKSSDGDNLKSVQERTYKFMSVMGGDMPGFEEASRALFKKDQKQFLTRIKDWPADMRQYILKLASPAFSEGEK